MNRFFRIAAVSVAVCAAALCLSACKSNKPPVVEPFDDTTTTVAADATTTVTYPTHATVAVPENQLTLNMLFALHSTTLPWSALESYNHTKTSDTTAEFVVADTFGHECMLYVTIDPDSGNLTVADLTYGDLTVTVLDDKSKGLLKMLRELNTPKE